MKLTNPIFKIQDKKKNIFTLREADYEQMLPIITEIVKPVEEIGFQINEVSLKESRFSSAELSKTLKQTLTIKLQKGTSNIDLSIFVPKLVDKNYIIINGRKKIPLFQLFDIPLVTRGESIKLRTNVATLMLFREKEAPFVHVSFLGKKVPLAVLLLAYYGPDEVAEKFDLKTVNVDERSSNFYENLLYDLKTYYEESKGYTQDDFILEIGRTYSKYNAKSKGHDIVYALDLIPKVDIITKKFLSTDSILDELVLAIQSDSIDDTLFTNKRVRCFEYMIYSKISKIIFDLCFSNRSTKQPKFNVNSTQILSECNVSDIIQFDFSINPIEELTKLSRISLLGPGGFKRENIPKHLRDISRSMFGRICPVDTPDRDNCGVLQNLLVNVDLDDDLKFTEKYCEKQPISIPVSFSPFCEHDDQTRLQMASSQMRQSILLKKFDEPMIKSGCEGLYTDHTQFIKRAKKDGEVVYIDNKYIIVVYNDSETEVFDIGFRKIYVEHMDVINVNVKPGEKFKAGDILAESTYCNDGNVVFGKNLLTGVMIHYGNNYEDGIVISDRLVEDDILTSMHFRDLSFTLPPNKVLLSLSKEYYKPLPIPFERPFETPQQKDPRTIAKGQPYAIIKTLTSEDLYSLFSEEIRLEAEKDFIIPEVKIYPNSWNDDVPEFKEWVEETIEKQQKEEHDLRKVLKSRLPKDHASQFIRENNLEISSFVGKYKNKREKINGIYIEMTGVFFRPIKVGDKIANRHGNKGVISKIIPHNEMPKLPDGRHLDVCINPLGIISRMNFGQLYELHLSMSLHDLKRKMIAMLRANKGQDYIKKYLIDYIKIIDKTDDKWYSKQFVNQLPKTLDEDFIQNLTLVQSPFRSVKIEALIEAMEYTETDFKHKIYDPDAKTDLINRIAAGYIYFFRMVHIAEEKLAARGIGTYAKRTLQPLGGRKNKGGQRCGEMETACIIGHDAPCNLFEFLTTKSDCIDLKNKYIRNFIDPNLVDESKELDTVPESVKLLNSYLTVIGVAQ